MAARRPGVRFTGSGVRRFWPLPHAGHENTEADTHVESPDAVLSDAGSTPAASTTFAFARSVVGAVVRRASRALAATERAQLPPSPPPSLAFVRELPSALCAGCRDGLAPTRGGGSGQSESQIEHDRRARWASWVGGNISSHRQAGSARITFRSESEPRQSVQVRPATPQVSVDPQVLLFLSGSARCRAGASLRSASSESPSRYLLFNRSDSGRSQPGWLTRMSPRRGEEIDACGSRRLHPACAQGFAEHRTLVRASHHPPPTTA